MGKQKLLVIYSLLLAFLVLGIGMYAAKVHRANQIQQRISALIANRASDGEFLTNNYMGVVDLLCHTPEWEISDENVSSAIVLMRNSDHQKENAAVVAALGSKATRALPDLEDALKKAMELESMKGHSESITSDEIKMFIGIIKSPPPSSRCHKNWL